MAMEVQIVDNSKIVLHSLDTAMTLALEAIGVQAESDVALMSPVDTGRLRASITHRQEGKDAVAIGTDVYYAIYQEFGTSKMIAANGGRGFLRPAITENLNRYKGIAEQIFRSVSI